MNVKVSKQALENTLRSLMKEVDDAPAAETFDSFKASLDDPNTREVTVGELGFEKVGDGWRIRNPLTDADLGALLGDTGQAKLEDAIKRGLDDFSLGPNDFVEPTARGVNFVRDPSRKDVWKDNTIISSAVVAAYKYPTQENINAARVGVSMGDLGVRDEEVTFILDNSANKFFIAPTVTVANDPLGTLDNLFRSRAFSSVTLGKFKMNDNEIKYVTPDDVKAIINIIDNEKDVSLEMNNIQGGDIEKALLKARTLFGKFFDIFRPGANLEMEFQWTTYGPAFRKSVNWFAAGSGRDMSAGIRDRFLQTDYFQEISPPTLGAGTYDVVVRSGSPVNGSGEITVSPDGSVAGASGITIIRKGLEKIPASDTLGYAYVLWKLGGIKLKAAPVEAPPAAAVTSPTSEPVPEQKKLSEILKVLEGKEVCPGAFFFQFDKSNIMANDPYKTAVRQAIVDVIAGSGEKDSDIVITFVGSADPMGTDNYNKTLAEKRADAAAGALVSITRSDAESIKPRQIEFKRQAPGESPWAEMASVQGQRDKNKLKNLRFAKAYWGDLDASKATELAKQFAIAKSAEENVALDERKSGLTESQLRAHIRRILLDG